MKRVLSFFVAVILMFSLTGCTADSGNYSQFVENGWYTDGEITMTEAELDAVFSQNYTIPKNVIIMIGDGMGPNDLTITEKFSKDCFDFGLILNQIPNNGLSTTYSANSVITDSAASATALATGHKTSNGVIGKAPDLSDLTNISEIAREEGKKVGIVTNDSVTGATPSGFTVHSVSRNNTEQIANSFIEFAPDVLVGQGITEVESFLDEENREKYEEEFVVSKEIGTINSTLNSDPTAKKPYIGFFEEDILSEPSNSLAHFTETALNRLNNDDGFFLMVENAGTDKGGHSNDIMGKIHSLVTFDRAVAVVLKFMKENPDTLLIITSDHETGGVLLPKKGQKPSYELFTTTAHTATDVRVFAVGYGSEYFNDKTVDNTDIAKFAIDAIEGDLK